MAVNHVVLVGKLTDAGPKLTYSDAGKPECRLTVMLTEASKTGQAFTVYVLVFVVGQGAEQAAEQLDAGDLVSVDGRLGSSCLVWPPCQGRGWCGYVMPPGLVKAKLVAPPGRVELEPGPCRQTSLP
jgi:Single-strand binding protein family